LPLCSIFFSDCPIDVNSILAVYPFGSRSFNAKGEFVCKNSGALFANNVSITNETMCGATAQWLRQDIVDCYTGKHWLFFTGNS